MWGGGAHCLTPGKMTKFDQKVVKKWILRVKLRLEVTQSTLQMTFCDYQANFWYKCSIFTKLRTLKKSQKSSDFFTKINIRQKLLDNFQ